MDDPIMRLSTLSGKDDYAAAATEGAAPAAPLGEVVVTTNEAGEVVLVSRQDGEGRILSIIWEGTPADLPPALPPSDPEMVKRFGPPLYTAEQMQAYARVALSAAQPGSRWTSSETASSAVATRTRGFAVAATRGTAPTPHPHSQRRITNPPVNRA